MSEPRYSREEVDLILGRAIERERGGDELSRDQLIGVASEIGVSAESIDNAIGEIVLERRKREELVLARRNAWRGFVAHLIPYLGVNSLLAIINYLTTSFPWVLFPMLGWGIGLVSHLAAVAMPDPERVERRLERQRDRERRRQLKRQIRAGAKELEVAVGQGFATLLQAAAERVQKTPAQHSGAPQRQRVADAARGASEHEPPHDESSEERRTRR
ncbi:MAG TPA: 2TM domain-containing protein [Polyangiaceae bacterium]